ncbi:MAG: biotin/lipoate A/B protein ligase family protein [Chthoniobacterales bacterium]
MLSSLTVLDDNVSRSAPLNMALDEVLWQSAATPCVRFYRWDHPALSFGYFGRYADVAAYQGVYDIVRRCTGGGIVFHGTDLTYALIVPAKDLLQLGSPIGVYTFVHTAVQNGLRNCGIRTDLMPADTGAVGPDTDPTRMSDAEHHRLKSSSSIASDTCFTRPVTADVLLADKKIAGAAQRRSRRGLLQQGSIQNVNLPLGFIADFVGNLSLNVTTGVLDDALVEDAQELVTSKYGTEVWLRRS